MDCKKNGAELEETAAQLEESTCLEVEETLEPAQEEAPEITEETQEEETEETEEEETEESEDEESDEDEEESEDEEDESDDEEAPKKRKKAKKARKPLGKGPKAVIAISLTLVILLGIASLALWGLGFNYASWGKNLTENGSLDLKNNLFIKSRYTGPDFLASMTADTVVATLGGQELTNGVLQMYYGRALWDIVEEYGSYLPYLGLDLSKPLSEQPFPGADGATWEQYLLNMALGAWAQQQTLVLMAEKAGFQYPAGMTEYLGTLETKLNEQAVANKMASGEALVKAEMGATASVENYKTYSALYNMALEYYAALYESIEPTPQQIEAYFDENAEALAEDGVTKVTKPVIDVRHILLIPDGGTVDAGTGAKMYSEEEWDACRQAAEALLEQWRNGEATEDSFAALANEHSEDPGSNTKGGLYEYVYQGDMVDAFNDWCFDASRQPGDTGIVKTSYGYHLMYFVYGADEWYRVAAQKIVGELCNDLLQEGYAQYPSKVYFYNIVLSEIQFN